MSTEKVVHHNALYSWLAWVERVCLLVKRFNREDGKFDGEQYVSTYIEKPGVFVGESEKHLWSFSWSKCNPVPLSAFFGGYMLHLAFFLYIAVGVPFLMILYTLRLVFIDQYRFVKKELNDQPAPKLTYAGWPMLIFSLLYSPFKLFLVWFFLDPGERFIATHIKSIFLFWQTLFTLIFQTIVILALPILGILLLMRIIWKKVGPGIQGLIQKAVSPLQLDSE